MSDFKIVTVSTGKPIQDYYCYDEFFISLGNHEPLVLKGVQGVNWSGLGSKPKMVLQAIKDGLIDTKHIIFCDCYDLVFAADPTELFENFKAMKSPFVISAERNCFPADLKDEYDKLPATSSYKYLNSGMIVAETAAMLTVLEAMELHNVPDDYHDGQKMVHINDQWLFMQIFLKQPVPMTLDHDQVLCNTLHSVSLDDLDFGTPGRFYNKETGVYPCAAHMNGSAKTDGLREPILRHLNLLQ